MTERGMRDRVSTKVGDQPAPREIGPITQTDIVRFAGAGGDFNRLHHDPEFVKSTGFPGVISMGQMQAGMLAAWLTDWCGVENLRSYAVRFVAPLRLGDVLTLSGEVVGIGETPIGTLADLELRAEAGDAPVVIATATIAVSD